MSSFLWGLLKAKEVQLSLGVAATMMLWGAGGVYLLEKPANEGITHFSDAVWWAIVTTTTVGYGDISPVTLGGRLIAVVLMFTGIGLIGSITASIAGHFTYVLSDRKKTGNPSEKENRIRNRMLESAHDDLDRIESLSPEEYRSFLRLIDTLRSEGEDPQPKSVEPLQHSKEG
ncbi:hypothetical protein CHM34_08710 [Paludifilum halophilum]|uniref:Potassium channel domain-containing protein n=1 Tax=Paludifilum halophilum TaxID=1642702 RepID=A0A235B9A2_9BACL|nr:hypothetical protein CHM34_08710 [Paludifilum halophilum]